MPVRYNHRWKKHNHIRLSARSLGLDRSLYFDMLPWTPPITNMEGVVAYYDPEQIGEAKKRLKGTNRKRYLCDIADRILKGARSDKERVARVCGFVSEAIYYNPIQQPVEPKTGDLIDDPMVLLELHDGRCGQGVMITLALLKAAGIECRQRDVFHHVTCEAKYDGKWHLADALMFGAAQPEKDGEVVNVAILRKDPYFADAFPLRHFAYTAEELLSVDGYRLLGYTFGDWGSLAYYSWYMGGDEDYPPMMPIVLPPLRLRNGRVRLRWAPSAKRNGGRISYRLRVSEDRARTRVIFSKDLRATEHEWSPPEMNRMYFVGVTATDDHVRKNPHTWYPEAVGNFVLVPESQYGWYGIF